MSDEKNDGPPLQRPTPNAQRPSLLPYAIGGIAALAVAAAVDAFLIEPVSVEVTHHDLPLPELPAAWEGARVVHLTDLHYGNPRSHRLLSGMVETVNDLQPDLIVITGDYVVREAGEVKGCVKYLSRLRARRGIYGTFGDHDYVLKTHSLHPGMVEQITGAGVTVLRNECVELPGGLRLSGTDANTTKVRMANLPAALAGMNGERPHLHLSHSPDILPEAAKHHLPMVLSGHTHGGQVVVPFYGPPITHTDLPKEYASGWSRMGDTRLYTSRGISSHFSLRFLCRPEIAVFRLCTP